MTDKAATIGELESAFRELQQSVDGVPDDQMAAVWFGEWSAKDILAHCASWDEFASLDFQRMGLGHTPCLAAFREADVNDWNGFLMRPRKLFSLAQVRFESGHCHHQLLDVLDGLPEGLFAPGNMLAAFLAITIGHYRSHAGNIRQWRQKEGL